MHAPCATAMVASILLLCGCGGRTDLGAEHTEQVPGTVPEAVPRWLAYRVRAQGVESLELRFVGDEPTGPVERWEPASGETGYFDFSRHGRHLVFDLVDVDFLGSHQLMVVGTHPNDPTITAAIPGVRFFDGAGSWSPDRAHLLIASVGADRLQIMDLSGDTPTLTDIPPVGSAVAGEKSWSPAGDRILLWQSDVLHVVRVDGGEPQVTTIAGNADSRASWSRGGSWIAFPRFTPDGLELWVHDGEHADQPAFLAQRHLAHDTQYRWIDDHRLLCGVEPPGSDTLELLVVDVAGGQAGEPMVAHPPSMHQVSDQWRLSSTGRWLAVSGDSDGDERFELWLTDLDETPPRSEQLADHAGMPVWASDASALVFQDAAVEHGWGNLYLATMPPTQGPVLIRGVDGGDVIDPAPSPDGRRVGYGWEYDREARRMAIELWSAGNAQHLAVTDSAGRKAEQYGGASLWSSRAWAPDSAGLAFPGEDAALWVLRWPGEAMQTTRLELSRPDAYVVDLRWQP